MPRQANGQYILPTGNPVVPDTLITSAWANPTLSDIGNALSDSLSRSGLGGMIAPLGIVSGSVSQPGVAFLVESGTGIYRAGLGSFDIGVQGINILSVNQQGLKTIAGSAPQPAIRLGSGATGLHAPFADTLGISLNGSDAIGFDPLIFRFGANTGGAYRALLLNGPTGTLRAINLQSSSVNRFSSGLATNDDYNFTAYTDGGAPIDEPLNIVRAAGGAVNIGGGSATVRPVNFVNGSVTVFNKAAPPAPPAASNVSLYVTGGALFAKDSAGVVTPIAPGGLTDLIGMIAWRHNADGKWLQCNGQTVSKGAYPALWTYAQGFLTVDQAASPGLYLDVDASNFKVPNLSGLFIRGQGTNDANHVSGVLGALQLDALQDHVHPINPTTNNIFNATGGTQGPTSGPLNLVVGSIGSPSAPARVSTETRSVNVALIPCVFAG